MTGEKDHVIHPTAPSRLSRPICTPVVYDQGLDAVDPSNVSRKSGKRARHGLRFVETWNLDDQFAHTDSNLAGDAARTADLLYSDRPQINDLVLLNLHQ